MLHSKQEFQGRSNAYPFKTTGLNGCSHPPAPRKSLFLIRRVKKQHTSPRPHKTNACSFYAAGIIWLNLGCLSFKVLTPASSLETGQWSWAQWSYSTMTEALAVLVNRVCWGCSSETSRIGQPHLTHSNTWLTCQTLPQLGVADGLFLRASSLRERDAAGEKVFESRSPWDWERDSVLGQGFSSMVDWE